MSFLICTMSDTNVWMCSEDRAGFLDSDGNFVLTGGGREKNIRVNDDIIFGVVGRNHAADSMKSVVRGLAHFSFSKLVSIIPTIARHAIECEAPGARLTMTLAGWDAEKQKMRGVIWNVWGDADDFNHIDVRPKQGGQSCQWVCGSGPEAQGLALRLMAQPDVRVPESFAGVFERLADTFPEIGRVLTTNSVTRPTSDRRLQSDVSDGSNYKKTTPNQIQYISPTTGQATTSTLLNAQLSVLPGQPVDFTKDAQTTTTLGVSWGTQSLGMSDGSSVSLTSGSQGWTGLTSNHTYYSYVYGTVSAGVMTLHFTQSSSASAPSAIATALDGRMPMGVIVDSTTASGTGGGGTYHPAGSCPHGDELVSVCRAAEFVDIEAQDVVVGDLIKGHSFAGGADAYRAVKSFKHADSTMWLRVNGRLCSPCEAVYVDGQWYAAWKAPGAERVRGLHGIRVEITVEADSHNERNYFLIDPAGGEPLLIHNFIQMS